MIKRAACKNFEVFRSPLTPYLFLKSRKPDQPSICCFTVSTLPHVHTDRCSSEISDVSTIFKSTVFILKTSSSQSIWSGSCCESTCALSLMSTWLGTYINVNCNLLCSKPWHRASSFSCRSGSSVPVFPKAGMKLCESKQMVNVSGDATTSKPTMSSAGFHGRCQL